MKKLLSLLIVFASFVAQAQIAWPPKAFPCDVPFILPAEIEYYWGVKKIICTGRSGNGYKFKVTGTGNHDHSAAQINMLYMQPSSSGGLPSGSMAGTYFFPAVEKGKPFYFTFEAAWKGTTPNRFSLFFMSEWISLPDNPEWENNPKPRVKAGQENKDYGNTANLANIEENPLIITDDNKEIDKRMANLDYKPEKTDEICLSPETLPEFPGGYSAMMNWISSTIRYPAAAQMNKIQGKVVVRIVVDKNGKATKPSISRSADPDLDREAIRVINKMPNLIPATVNGQPVNAYLNIPFTFKLN